jgi:hypothetical protein
MAEMVAHQISEIMDMGLLGATFPRQTSLRVIFDRELMTLSQRAKTLV